MNDVFKMLASGGEAPSLGQDDREKIRTQVADAKLMAEMALMSFEVNKDNDSLIALGRAEKELARVASLLADHTARFVNQAVYHDENGADTDPLDS